MTTSSGTDDGLSAAVVAYLQSRNAPSPGADAAAVAAVAGPAEADRLVGRVAALVRESLSLPIGWDELDLSDAGGHVAAEMRRRHPELSPEAADALAWSFTYSWR